ncbi:MAG: hypothetical protein CM15mP62_13000 [Rhodospirillaceae bacterium]|nr:MAG: hypothetical protein CM15mP62_13000 [Rhodospirillaceae bacterium]
MSLAAMEAALMPDVMETFDKIATIYGKLKKGQDRRLSPNVERRARYSTKRTTVCKVKR